jgi:hypothetical protein
MGNVNVRLANECERLRQMYREIAGAPFSDRARLLLHQADSFFMYRAAEYRATLRLEELRTLCDQEVACLRGLAGRLDPNDLASLALAERIARAQSMRPAEQTKEAV